MEISRRFEGVYTVEGKIATKSLVKGSRAYKEEVITFKDAEYRLWNPYRSKLSAAVLNGLKRFEIKPGSSVLYLGAATGTTPSHISDIVGDNGRVYCVEFSERNMRQLIRACESRPNMLPILSDARETGNYKEVVEPCDIIYQDVSSRDQSDILLRNRIFLKNGGNAYFIIKSQSVDISKKPSDVFRDQISHLEGSFNLLERVKLEPYDSMHMFTVLKKI